MTLMTWLTSAFSTAHTKERPLSNLSQLLIVVGVLFISAMVFWTVVYGTTYFNPYHVSGVSLEEDIVCPLGNVTVRIDDELNDNSRLIDMSQGRIEVHIAFVGITGQPTYPEVTFPVDLNEMRQGGETLFARIAPDKPGEYIVRGRVVAKGHVANYPIPRTVEFPIADSSDILVVKSPLDTECPVSAGAE